MPTQFETEWLKVRESVLRRCRQLLSNSDDAEDVCQEICLRALAAYPRFRGECAFATWIYRIATRECYRYRHRWHDGPSLGPEHAEIVDPTPPPGAALRSGEPELEPVLGQAVAAGVISELEATLIRYRCLEEPLTWQEIEAVLEISNGPKLYMFARQRLRVYLFLHQPHLLGGRSAIRAAFQKATAGANPLTPAEQRVFSEYILRDRVRHRTVFRDRDLRTACAKVALQLRGAEEPGD